MEYIESIKSNIRMRSRMQANHVFCFKAEVELIEISNHLMAELHFAGFYWRQMMTTNGISTEAFH